jgi:hypothetical protein
MPIWPSHRSGRIRRLPWQPPTLNKAIRRCRGRFMKRPYINATSLPAHHRAAKRPRAKPPRQKLASHKIGRGPGDERNGTAKRANDTDRDPDELAIGTDIDPGPPTRPSAALAVPGRSPRRAGPQGPRARPLGRGPGADAPGKRQPGPRLEKRPQAALFPHGGSRENGTGPASDQC